MSFLNRLFSRKRTPPIVIVSGLPRSGTSMMMKMLEAGGLELFSDGVREADVDNPNGYFEHERIRTLMETPDRRWLTQARGKAIKVIAFLLDKLPRDNCYDVIYINRRVDEVVASQNKMLEHRGEPLGKISPEETAAMLTAHSRKVRNWLNRQPNFRMIEVDYAEAVQGPQKAANRVARFLGGNLDREQMAAVIDPSLYRNRQESAETT